MQPVRVLQMDAARLDEELAVFQGMSERRIWQIPFLFGRRPFDNRAVVDGRALDGDRVNAGAKMRRLAGAKIHQRGWREGRRADTSWSGVNHGPDYLLACRSWRDVSDVYSD